MFFVYFLFMQEAFVKEKTEGNLETLLSSPIRPLDLWLSKTIAIFALSYIIMITLSSIVVAISYLLLGTLTISLNAILALTGLLPMIALFFFGISGILALTLKNANQAGLPIILLAILVFFLKNDVFNSLTIYVVHLLALIGFIAQYIYVKKMPKDRIILTINT